MRNRLFIGIGIQCPDGLADIPGVHDVIQSITEYVSLENGYDPPLLFLDKDGKDITCKDIKAVLTADVLLDRPRIVVYFCGHGAFLNGQEIWYLSKGATKWTSRVDVAGFRQMLATYQPKQISIFSDACQTAEAEAVAGTAVLDECEGDVDRFPKIDIFRATIRGRPAFATSADGPLFSKLIATVLAKEPPEEALDRQYLNGGQRVVSSQSMATYIEDNLPDYVALGAGKKQITELVSGFRYDTNDYLKLTPVQGRAPQRPLEQSLEMESANIVRQQAEIDLRRTETKLMRVLDEPRGEREKGYWEWINSFLDGRRVAAIVVVLNPWDWVHWRLENEIEITLPPGFRWEGHWSRRDGASIFEVFIDAPTKEKHPQAAVLRIFEQEFPLELYVDPGTLVLSFDFRERGTSLTLTWRGEYSRYERYNPLKILDEFLSGGLTADLVTPFAAEMRYLKHSNPLYGIVAAYLYDRIGDLDGIRRMCLFYRKHNQPIPFDIAMLSRLEIRRRDQGGYCIDVPDIEEDENVDRSALPDFVWQQMTGERNLSVAGFAPLLTVGWLRLHALATDEIRAITLRSFQRGGRGPFTAFRRHSKALPLSDLFRFAFFDGV